MINEPFHILIVFLGIISVTLTLTSRYVIATKMSPVILILFFTAILSNTGIIPTEHVFYKELSGYAVPFAVCLILLHVSLADVLKTGLPVLKAFAVASIGSFIGCLVAGILLRSQIDNIFAGSGWKLAGPYIGTYIGGSLNFFSMWSGLKIDNPDLFAAANAVDNLTLIPMFMFWVAVPQVLKKWYPEISFDCDADVNQSCKSEVKLNLKHLTWLAFTGFLIIFVSGNIKKYIVEPWIPQIPTILLVTTISLLVAQFKGIKDLKGAKELGNLAFYLFFATIGAMMDIPKAIGMAPVLFIYVAVIIVTQIIFVILVGKLLKIDLKMLAVASIAAKAGPSTVVAYTNAKNWNNLALPGVAAGLLGYAIGNYLALGGAYLLKFLIS